MIAKQGYLYRLLDGTDKKFIIPVYQRPYSWKKENCELLIKDLLNVSEKGYQSHFFGSVVYLENDIGGYNEYIIIDGQQRITTVSLLLLAIRNYITDKNIEIAGINAEKITEAYLTDKYAAGEKKLKLKLVQGDDDAYDRLIEKTAPLANNNVTLNYNYFYNTISDLSFADIKGLYDAIMKLMVVNISLKTQDGDDPQLIFESLNSTGLDLEEADKIRNYILMRMSSSEQERIYKNYWEKLEDKVSKEDINKFIRYYLAVKTHELTNESKLYFAFKNYKEKFDKKIEDLLKAMLEFADYYNIIKNANLNELNYLGSIARINKLEVNTVIPLLFDLLSANKNGYVSEDELSKALNAIECYIARRIVCGLPTSSLNKIFAAMGAEINKYMEENNVKYIDALIYSILSKTGKSRLPNDHEFAENFVRFELYTVKPSAIKYFFERLENFNNKERVAVEDQVDKGDLTIEHIMPQTLTAEWKRSLGEQWELIHSKYLNTVGNLTLTAYNSDYSNLAFEKKKTMAEKGFLYSKLSLNSYVRTCDIWGENEITKRAESLCDIAKEIWKSPTTEFSPNIIEEWVSLDDDMDFTNKVIVKIKLLGDEILTDNVTDVYKKVNATLYMLDTVKFAKRESIYQNEDPSKLRSPYQLSSTMYIETNLSSQLKMNVLRDLFEYFEIDLQDLKVLVRPTQKSKVEFDINDERTYNALVCGKLAYELISKLLKEKKLSEEEREALMTKNYTRQTFKDVNISSFGTFS